MRGYSRDTTADHWHIDVRLWQRKRVLRSGYQFTNSWSRNGERTASIGVRVEDDCAILTYTHSRPGSESRVMEYPVYLEWTVCHYGGSRAWFRCPARGCGRRVAILYCAGIFACRKCLQLAYESQNEPPHSRALSKAQNILIKLGGTGSMADLFPPKPKWMHWKTYHGLMLRYETLADQSWPPWLLR